MFDKQHIREYFIYGSIAALLYMIPVWFFLKNNAFQNLYLLFVGSLLFMFCIFFYAYKLIYRPYPSRKAVAMLTAGNLASMVGVAISVILVLISVFLFFPHLIKEVPHNQVLSGSPVTLQPDRPIGLLGTILLVTIIGNIAVGSFISIITAYAGRSRRIKD